MRVTKRAPMEASWGIAAARSLRCGGLWAEYEGCGGAVRIPPSGSAQVQQRCQPVKDMGHNGSVGVTGGCRALGADRLSWLRWE